MLIEALIFVNILSNYFPFLSFYSDTGFHFKINPLSANRTEWSNTLKQFVG